MLEPGMGHGAESKTPLIPVASCSGYSPPRELPRGKNWAPSRCFQSTLVSFPLPRQAALTGRTYG